ncbi:MAG TPA: UvrD-helicase domain-containing protein [Usitatibacter sp.]|nr:UvrD-helicase domain-containing protein [Usitatibacter sp.]
MTEPARTPDWRQREEALDAGRSFIVQAPAGSGKTELLIQRYLALLGRVDRPEEIVAITFTIKAAAEMRKRVFDALRAARLTPRPQAPHMARTWDLARAAIVRNDELGWRLDESADRLHVQTIDALCASLTRQMPVLSRFGAQPEPVEKADHLYAEAARNVLAALEEAGSEKGALVATLLEHIDNNVAKAQGLLATMLAQRDHWIRTVVEAPSRATLERALAEVRESAVSNIRGLWPASLALNAPDDAQGWSDLAGGLLTKDGGWRARGVPPLLLPMDEVREALHAMRALPDATYTDDQWAALDAIVKLAPLAVAELQVVFASHGQADFIEIAQGAVRALGPLDDPTDLLLSLDYRIRHILVDEFQDTSHSQYELLLKLTSGWEPGDGRTLFLVGDPMQSIYRFREAEVALFLKAWRGGIGSVKLAPLTLSSNFRSQAGIVSWVNAAFEAIMPGHDDMHRGAVRYSRSEPVHEERPEAVTTHPFFDGDAGGEAEGVAARVGEALDRPGLDPAKPSTAAILVRNRSHLREVIPRLHEAKIPFRAIEIEELGNRPVVQDLLALTRALTHPADRVAWLAVLRAPWCGLCLADLLVLAGGDDAPTLWEALHDESRIAALSADGRARAAKALAVLARAMDNRRRSTLRDAVESAWLAFGGPACVERDTDLEDADIYLDHLEAHEEAGALADLEGFVASLDELYALPDLAAPDRLQVMTIHKAKGLEFDTVIVPGLSQGARGDERRLFMWMETPEGSLLLAPINPTGRKNDSTYEFIRQLDKDKASHENARLLYVAATRAKHRLHLMGDVGIDNDGAVKEPAKHTLLGKIWPAVREAFQRPRDRAPKAPSPPVAREDQAKLRRLVLDMASVQVPPPVKWAAAVEERGQAEIEFSWVGDTARRVGSVVHRYLQRIAEDEAKDWTKKRVEAEKPAIRAALAARGVVDAEMDAACNRVVAALAGAVTDKRGRWLLGPQRKARNEYRLSTMAGGARRTLVIDRLFEDDVGDTWIVDYKTSMHEGADVEAFLDEEKRRYHAQLERYAAATDNAHARRGLYFPLLKGWREWTREDA